MQENEVTLALIDHVATNMTTWIDDVNERVQLPWLSNLDVTLSSEESNESALFKCVFSFGGILTVRVMKRLVDISENQVSIRIEKASAPALIGNFVLGYNRAKRPPIETYFANACQRMQNIVKEQVEELYACAKRRDEYISQLVPGNC